MTDVACRDFINISRDGQRVELLHIEKQPTQLEEAREILQALFWERRRHISWYVTIHERYTCF